MRVHYAVTTKEVIMGGLYECLQWARSALSQKKAKVVKIFSYHAGDKKAQIIFDVTTEGFFPISNGQWLSVSLLKRALKDG